MPYEHEQKRPSSDDASFQMLLQEFRDIRNIDLKDLREQVAKINTDAESRLTVLEAHVKSGITGNGSPSRLSVIEKKMEGILEYKYWLVGIAAGVSGFVSIAACVIGFIFHLFGH
jgi:hypothetical protein